MRRAGAALALLALLSGGADAATIKLNQLGFAPAAAKLAVVPAAAATSFEVVRADGGATVLSGALGAPLRWQPSAETVRLADFSSLSTPGSYRLKVAGAPLSDAFSIGPQAYRVLNAAALRAYYLARAGSAIPASLGGPYARALGHPDDHVLVHASAASPGRPEGSVIASAKGWYDAGDYNKYVVNSGISTYTLLAAYEHFPAYFAAQKVGLPESGNGLPDILNEALWNLDWMLSMQDPADGGVYHKLTNKRFDAFVMPDRPTSGPRYVVQKSTAAALDFSAVMATAARVLAPFEHQLAGEHAGLPARMLAASEAAWKWAEAHPAVVFKNPPDISTGEYGDADLADEREWAAAELYISTGKDSYYAAMHAERTPNSVPSWGQVQGLAWISLAQHMAQLGPAADRKLIASRIDSLAATLAGQWSGSAYKVSLRQSDFIWGSNAVALNQAMMLLQAYRLDARRAYLDAAQSDLDYVLGRNAVGYAFVTGFGTRSPMHPHHRPSAADGVAAPVPGWLVGGAQAGQQDKAECKAAYPSSLPALSYLDDQCSYSTNEVAINWNAPLVYVTAALDVLTGPAK